ncbi:uncharacterized protein M6B38_264510 [Iris pallida]|uniref:Uncharacterized protein n=1 Tax=Iris pallida TaxID=29817 RepID=A0AAX6IBK4_IRIPA|nr:uncharacterized protein M6B38_264510 [Iris pallida]
MRGRGRSGGGGEDPIRRRQRRHMWPVPAPATPAPAAAPAPPPPQPVGPPAFPSSSSAAASLSSSLPSSDSFVEIGNGSVSFLKDGRKIQVGDCALFQAGNAPPFIGIIRWLTTGKEDCPKLCVNWLYRPADIKLAKGILLEAAPNEVFYSFHKDVISAGSLLHPCKVAFLRKGIELPSGISSFVCRRVYDTENKCLWWLTDQDYINERQEEVDQLLDRTRLEMHAAVQSGGRSPKPLNAPTSTQQLKSGSDILQNSGTSFPSQTKGKKRERGDQGAEPVKRERPNKTEDGDHTSCRLDTMLKNEIAKITEEGALVATEGVEKLVHLMQLGNERKIDLAGRILLVDVIAATDKIECLGRLVQLKGLSFLDDWLQEAHKGKTGDGTSPKESDKSTEELLLALLHALDKLPVNLTALRTCNIGKSVNNLRSHKNLEIQKKSRSLIDTWKKRVGAEMTKNNDAKPVGSNQAVTWSVKPSFSEAPHTGSRQAVTEATSKSAIIQPSACKMSCGKPVHADSILKPTVSPGTVKLASSLPSAAISSKESPRRGASSSGTPDLPLATVKEEKSSSSSQSQNNSQSCSSDHAKTMGSSWKEDARSSTAGSVNASKTSGGSSRHRRATNGFPGSNNSGVQKEVNMDKSGSVNRSTTLDKLSTQSGLSCERTLDIPGADHGNGHRLIVRLPNPGRSPARCSPARSASGGYLEDPLITGSRASSPGPDRFDHVDRKTKVKGDPCRSHISTDVNAESWQINDVKQRLVGSDEGDKPPIALRDEEHRSADEVFEAGDVPKAVCPLLGNEKGGSMIEPKTRNAFTSINALVESCAKYSEASAPLSAGDDIGMNLLASVAAGEMSKSGIVSPSGSPGSSPAKDDPCAGNNEAKSRISHEDGVTQSHVQSDENADTDSMKQGKVAGSVSVSQEIEEMSIHFSDDRKTIAPLQENKLTTQQVGQHAKPSLNLYKVTEVAVKAELKYEKDVSTSIQADTKEGLVVDGICKSAMVGNKSVDCTREKIVEGSTKISELVSKSSDGGCDNEIAASGRKSEKSIVEEPLACIPSDQAPNGPTLNDKHQSSGNHVEVVDGTGDNAVASSNNGTDTSCKIVDEPRVKKCDEFENSHLDPSDSGKKEISIKVPSSIDDSQAASAVSLGTINREDGVPERKEDLEHHPAESASHGEPYTIPAREAEICSKPSGSKLSGADPDRRAELANSAKASSFIIKSQPDIGTKFNFDLNEGLPGDDVNQSEPITSAGLVCLPAVRFPSLAPFVSGSLSTGPPAPVTVAAPAKGPFVPPENLLKNKGEPGWKGSAATSAFRPAEPRKVLEMPLNTSDVLSADTATGRLGRPPLDIDLNIPDDRVLEDTASRNSPQTNGSGSGAVSNRDAPARSSGGLDLDLNRVDEGMENGQFLATTSNRLDMPFMPARPFSGGYLNGEANMFRDFDLNNGPGLDDAGVEPVPKGPYVKSGNSVPFLSPITGLGMGNAEMGNVSSWFQPSNSYQTVAIPSFFPDRREQPYPIVAAPGTQRILGPVSGGTSFGGDVYRGPVLSSSPAMAFSATSAFSYAGFPFGASFPLTSTSYSGGSTTYVDSSTGAGSCFPAIPSQFVGTAGGVSSHYPRPYVVSLPEGSTSAGSESNRKWDRQGLDLNSGPGSADVEVKDDRWSSALRQLPMSSSQAFVEEQARIYQVAGGGVKRKEREGGPWDERFYKQPSWQ